MGVNVGDFYAEDSSSTWKLPLLYNYTYDQLNRLTKMDAFYGLNQNTNSWSGLNTTLDYKERIAYDPNGNISKYLRNSNNNAGTEHAMDSLNYFYNTATNQLNHIKDNAEDWIGGGKDLQDQSSNNYGYDPSGNMIKDLSRAITDGGFPGMLMARS
jgi:hypothetical protein